MKAKMEKVKSGIVIKRCACKHEFQDGRYGSQMRVHIVCKKGNKCTVCGDIKN